MIFLFLLYVYIYSGYCSRVMLRKPFGVMVSSPDQTPQVPFMFFLIIHYFERPASSVRLVKVIHLRVRFKLANEVKNSYKSRAGKPRNFLQLSDNDVEFCRNVVQATARFVLVSLCVV